MATAGRKRPLFNKPAWSSSPSSTKTAQDDPFRNRVYEEILEAQRRRKEEQAAKAKTRAENDSTKPKVKRRRISDEGEDGDGSDRSRSINLVRDDAPGTEDEDVRPVNRSTADKTKGRSIEKRPPRSPNTQRSRKDSQETRTVAIELGDDREDGNPYSAPAPKVAAETTRTKPKAKSPYADPLSDEDEDEDEGIKDLKRQIREKVRLHKMGVGVEKPPMPTPPATDGDVLSALLPGSTSPLDAPNSMPASISTVSTADDPNVKIYIISKIPGAKPLIINQRASLSLKLAKEYWCNRQGFDAAKTAAVFLTWRGTKLFNASTMKPILEKLKTERPMEVFNIPAEEDDPVKEKIIELEAMTEEIYEQYQRNREHRALAAESPNYVDSASAAPNAKEVSRPRQDGIVIQLLCQGLPPMKLRVRSHTQIFKIMSGFKKTQNVEPNRTCWLVFDGERLDPESTVEDVGLEHEDTVEVHLR